MNIELVKYDQEMETAADLIRKFWKEHNNVYPSYEEACSDLLEWTKKDHCFYFIRYYDNYVGFVHLGSRGDKLDWLEDIFVLPEFQNKGIGSKVIQLIEEIVKEYSDSLYIEVASKNKDAIRLYYRNGYNCLNTITIRKDFDLSKCEIIGNEKIMDMDFEVKKYK